MHILYLEKDLAHLELRIASPPRWIRVFVAIFQKSTPAYYGILFNENTCQRSLFNLKYVSLLNKLKPTGALFIYESKMAIHWFELKVKKEQEWTMNWFQLGIQSDQNIVQFWIVYRLNWKFYQSSSSSIKYWNV